jgi:hypothetical protein
MESKALQLRFRADFGGWSAEVITAIQAIAKP